jgi:hypothetical protein
MKKSIKELEQLSYLELLTDYLYVLNCLPMDEDYSQRIAQVIHQRMFNEKMYFEKGKNPHKILIEAIIINLENFEGLPVDLKDAFANLKARYSEERGPIKKHLVDSLNISDYEDKVGLVKEDWKK